MEVFKKTVSAVFSPERRYVIPLFQRPYVWTRESQWEPLWSDIVERADLELGQHADETPPHFLGAIVIQQRRSWGDELLAHDVIDGQQRLTTFQILLFAFRDIAKAGDDRAVAASLLSWTVNPNSMSDAEVEQFKVWPTSRDEEQYRFVATAGSRMAVEEKHPPVYYRKRIQPRPRMIEAYLFFHERISEWLTGEGAATVVDRTRALRRVLDKRLQLVSIELEKEEEPQAIFETLNARGVPLLASDLLRNYIFQRAGADAEALHQKYWERFEIPDDRDVPDGDRFWEVEQRQGRFSRARLDLFVQHYLAMKTGQDVLSGRLFAEYKKWITDKRPFPGVEDELRDLAKFADHFAALLRPDLTTSLGQFAERLRVLDTSTVYPLVLALLGNGKYAAEERDGIFVDLESFLVRRMICARTAKNYNRLFLQIVRELDGLEPTRAAFRRMLSIGTGEAVDWPRDDEFRKAWTTIDAYVALKAARVEMLLRRIEQAMTTAATEKITIHGKLSIEHVMPQSWGPHWPLPADVSREVAEQRREDLVHDFGNLTLLTQTLNATVSNGPAAQKLPRIALNAALRLNSHFQNRTTWTEADIEARGAMMFEHALAIWPGPSDA